MAEALDDKVRQLREETSADTLGARHPKKSIAYFQPTRVAETYQAISTMHQEGFEVSHLCNALGVHRNGYYQWIDSSENIYQHQDQKLVPLVQDIFFQHKRRYGARRISMELKDRGESCSPAKAGKIMVQTGLVAIQPKAFWPRTTDSRHKLGYSPNLLLEGIEVERINQVWVGDITYIPLPTSFPYLAMLLDLHSRKSLGGHRT